MSLLSRLLNPFRKARLNREIDEELESHVAEAIESGRDPNEARRALGSPLRLREQSRDAQMLVWAETLLADVVLGLRRLGRNRLTSAAVVLSLALAAGASIAGFQLMDALLLKPLPIHDPQTLHTVSYRSRVPDWPERWDRVSYPLFRELREATEGLAEIVAVAPVRSWQARFSNDDPETIRVQSVSGEMFTVFGLAAATGRLLRSDDDRVPGVHPVAVLSHDYWQSRFGGSSDALGATFQLEDQLYEIVGVVAGDFAGVEPGFRAEVFLPTMMAAGVDSRNRNWLNLFVRPSPNTSLEPLREKLHGVWREFEAARRSGVSGISKGWVDTYLEVTETQLERAASGASRAQRDYARPLRILGLLAFLVLLVACANVANLLAGQAAARNRDMALRMAIGAGRSRLVRLVAVEAALLGLAGVGLGVVFSLGFSRYVLNIIRTQDRALDLDLSLSGRLVLFSVLLAVAVAFLCGLPSMRKALQVSPSMALRGGGVGGGRVLMRTLVAGQIAFTFVVLLVASLLLASLDRLLRLPIGFDPQDVVVLRVRARPERPPDAWALAADRLRAYPGVENVALAEWPLLSGSSTSLKISVEGKPVEERSTEFLCISAEWLDVLKIPLLEGRALRRGDTYPQVALVNRAFAQRHFERGRAVSRTFEIVEPGGERVPLRIVGVIGDVRQNELSSSPLSAAYVPCRTHDANGVPEAMARATFLVRTDRNQAAALAPALRRVLTSQGYSIFDLRVQQDYVDQHTHRERLLAILAGFFAVVVLLLAALGIYGVVHYSIKQRRRELCVRMALGAVPLAIARSAGGEMGLTVFVGVCVGGVLGLLQASSLDRFLYGVKTTNLLVLAAPAGVILLSAIVAALPAIIKAVHMAPAPVLKSE